MDSYGLNSHVMADLLRTSRFRVLKVKREPAYRLSRPPIVFSLLWVDLFHAILFRVLQEPAFQIS
jgi:hypothetical protein